MPKIGSRKVHALLFLFAFTGCHGDGALLRFRSVSLGDGLSVYLGAGGNSVALDTNDGVMLVDTKLLWGATELRHAIARQSPSPVRLVVYTHYHLDHASGTAAFPRRARVAAHRNVAADLTKFTSQFGVNVTDTVPPDLLIDAVTPLSMGGEEIVLVPTPGGHTNGDLAIWLPARRVLVVGDLWSNGYFPHADPNGSGSFLRWVDSIDQLAAFPAARVIPGHGEVGGPADLTQLKNYLHNLRDALTPLVKAGFSEQEAAASLDLADLGLRPLPFLSSHEGAVHGMYDELLHQ